MADTCACTLTYDLDVFVVIQQQILHLQISVSTIADIGKVRLEDLYLTASGRRLGASNPQMDNLITDPWVCPCQDEFIDVLGCSLREQFFHTIFSSQRNYLVLHHRFLVILGQSSSAINELLMLLGMIEAHAMLGRWRGDGGKRADVYLCSMPALCR